MFETVAPEQFARRSRRASYEALPASIAVHAAIIATVMAAHLWTLAFPSQAPHQVATFSVAEPPPPPPPPPPPKARTQQLPEVQQLVHMPKEILAPAIIPEEIPVVSTPITMVAFVENSSRDGVDGGVPGGEIGGVFGGISGGSVGGVLGGTPGGVVTEPNRVIVERDRPLPMYPLSQVYPAYPEEARLRSWEDQLVVRYVIGKNGRTREVTVISPPERPIFAEATLRAIRRWRFRPLVRDGERQEVVHELTVFYKLHQAG